MLLQVVQWSKKKRSVVKIASGMKKLLHSDNTYLIPEELASVGVAVTFRPTSKVILTDLI